MAVGVESDEAIDIFPHLFVGRMKNMGTIPMVFDAGGWVLFGIAITAYVVTFFYYQYPTIQLRGDPFCYDGSEETAAHNYIGIAIQVHALVMVLTD